MFVTLWPMWSARRLVLGTPEEQDGPGLVRILRRGDDLWRVRAARALAEREEEQAATVLREVLADPLPGVRRASALGLGWRGEPADREALGLRVAQEACTGVLVAAASAWVRCGGPPAQAASALARRGSALVRTATGWRSPESSTGYDERALQRELLQYLDPALANREDLRWEEVRPRGRGEIRAHLRSWIRADPHSPRGRQAIEELALQGHPEDLELLRSLRAEAGRRTDHVLIIALGKLGDPRGLPDLLRDLDRMDIDPGRGFTYRRMVALALGRIGVPSEVDWLLKALEVEATHYEGRPGAGLGIQFPVRSNILWAIGELQALRSARTLVSYLSNLHGSALGGFHLPALSALIKLGDDAAPELARAALVGEEIGGLNAVGALEAIGRRAELERIAAAGGRVGEAAAAALAGEDRPARAWRRGYSPTP